MNTTSRKAPQTALAALALLAVGVFSTGCGECGCNPCPPPAPAVTSVTDAAGTIDGGSTVVVRGTDFTDATAVTFGGVAGTAMTVTSATEISVTTPAGAAVGAVDVAVTTPSGTGTMTGAYTYEDDAGGAPYPMPPVAGENNDVSWGSAVYDRPTMYVSRDVPAGKFKNIIIAIPHSSTRAWKFNTVTTSGGVITFNFVENTATGSASVWVYVDASASTRSLSGITSVRAVATLSGGGSDDVVVDAGGSDDGGTITTWTTGMPFFWHKVNGSNVEVGGFLYGLNNQSGTSQVPTTFSAPSPDPGTPGIMLASTTNGTAKAFQAIPMKSFSNLAGTNPYRAELNLSPTTADRGFAFKD